MSNCPPQKDPLCDLNVARAFLERCSIIFGSDCFYLRDETVHVCLSIRTLRWDICTTPPKVATRWQAGTFLRFCEGRAAAGFTRILPELELFLKALQDGSQDP